MSTRLVRHVGVRLIGVHAARQRHHQAGQRVARAVVTDGGAQQLAAGSRLEGGDGGAVHLAAQAALQVHGEALVDAEALPAWPQGMGMGRHGRWSTEHSKWQGQSSPGSGAKSHREHLTCRCS